MSAFLAQSHRVLVIPELLDMIFSFLDDTDNASNAQVCKLWSTVALDVIWKEPSNLHRLFSMLVPLVLFEEHMEYVFEHLPSSADWRRFDRYASRVRKLVYTSQDLDSVSDSHVHQRHNPHSPFDSPPLSRRIFDDIARTRTRMDIFPNLHTLVWMPYTYSTRAYQRAAQSRQLLDVARTRYAMHVFPWDATVFMHARVKIFAFYLPQESERGMEHRRPNPKMSPQDFVSARTHFLSDIALRMPGLRTLDVRTSLRASSPSSLSSSLSHATVASNSAPSLEHLTPPTPQLQDDLGALLLSLPTLHKLILPRFFFTTRIAEAAARVPNLGVVEFQYLASQGCGWAGDVFPPTGGFVPDLSSFDSGSSSGVVSKPHAALPAKSKPFSALRLFTGPSASSNPVSSPTISASREEGPFPALYDLSLTSTFGDLAAFLDGPHYNPSRLTSIYVDSACVVETNRDLGKLARVLLENCGMLRYVALVSMRDPGLVRSHVEVENEEAIDSESMLGPGRDDEEAERGTIEEIERENPYITLPTILPLLALPLLTSLELTHAWPLGLSLSDIATVASNLPGLETLLLNTEPVHLYLPVSSPLHQGRPSSVRGSTEQRTINVPGLEVLSVVARRCRLLRHFGVFLDATGVGELGSAAARRLRQVGGGDGSVPPSPVKRALRVLPFNVDSESEGEHEDRDAIVRRDAAAVAPLSLSSPAPTLSLSFSSASPTFSATLARLSLGVSAITDGDADAAALYLSHVLPLGCVIDFGVTWEDGLGVNQRDGGGGGGDVPLGDEDMAEDMDDDDDDGDAGLDAMGDAPGPAPAADLAAGHGQGQGHGQGHSHSQQPVSAALRAHRTHALHLTVQARCAVWERVAAQVPLLARLRQEERVRTRAMERELEALRAREDRRAREQEGGVIYGNLGDGMGSGGEGVRMNLAAAAATRKKSWLNLKELGREWLHL